MPATDFPGHIHFFDIKSRLPGNHQSWSPNTLKVRMTLNYKEIPYVETFLSYPDIAPFAAKFGIPPDEAGWNPPRATLPAILHYDREGKLIKAMSNSIDIARYLDEIYPDKPVLGPRSSGGWDNTGEAYWSALRQVMNGPWRSGYEIIIPTIPPILDDRGSRWFIADRQANDDEKRSPLNWGPADKEEGWKIFLKDLDALSRTVNHTTDSSPYLLGTEPSYADFAVAGFFTWVKRGSESNYQKIIQADGGDKGPINRHYQACEKWVLGEGKIEGIEL